MYDYCSWNSKYTRNELAKNNYLWPEACDSRTKCRKVRQRSVHYGGLSISRPVVDLWPNVIWRAQQGAKKVEGSCSRNNIVARFHPSFMRDDLHWGGVATTCTGNWCLWPDLSRKQFPAAAVFIQTWQTRVLFGKCSRCRWRWLYFFLIANSLKV